MIRSHWWFSLWGSTQDAGHVLRWRNVAGGHAKTIRPLFQFGPWAIYAVRHAPGYVPDEPMERVP